MIGIHYRIEWNGGELARRLAGASYRFLHRAAGGIRKVARESIRRSRQPAAEGSPPHTQTGKLPDAIIYHVDEHGKSALVGPSGNLIADTGAYHELGGKIRRTTLGKRPYLSPALRRYARRMVELYNFKSEPTRKAFGTGEGLTNEIWGS